MAGRILQICIKLLGCSAIIIGGAIFVFGPDFVGRQSGALLALLSIQNAYSGSLTAPSISSEMGFYSTFWMAYGVWLLKISQEALQGKAIPLALGIFFIGGTGRLISMTRDGAPDMLFVILMWIELIAPVLMLFLWLAVKNENRNEHPNETP